MSQTIETHYKLSWPRRIEFGNERFRRLPEYLRAERTARVLLVTGNSFPRTETYQILMHLFSDAGLTVSMVTGIAPEPDLPEVDRVLEAGRAFRPDAVVGIGGGSVIDVAKVAAALIPLDGSFRPYFEGRAVIPGKGLWYAALPTTAGTGAEMTSNSVLTDPETGVKKSLRSPFMVADVAIVDPLLLLGCPASVVAASGLDAFVQALESVLAVRARTASNGSGLILQTGMFALTKIYAALPRFFRNPNDAEARTELAEGSMLSGMAFSQTGLGAVHGLAHPLGSILRVPHGLACAILLPKILRFNLSVCAPLYAELAALLELPEQTPEAFLASIDLFLRTFDVPDTFARWGFSPEHVPFVVENCRSASMRSNPCPMSDDDVRDLLAALF